MAKEHTSHKSHHSKHADAQAATTPASDSTLVIIVVTVLVMIGIFAAGLGVYAYLTSDATPSPVGPSTNTGGKIIITEFSDFECPYCERGFKTVQQVKAQYGDQVEIVFKHFPLPFHANAQKAAEASECARDQGKFWEYHDTLFTHQSALTVADLKRYAADLKLDTAKFNTCLDTSSKADLVAKDKAEGQSKGVSGTPTFFIGTDKIEGAQPLAKFQEVIAKYQGTGTTAGTTATAPAKPDPAFGITVIKDSSCSVCDTQRVTSMIKSNIFPSATITEIEMTDAKAKALIEKYDIGGVPAYIFDSAVTQTANFEKVSNALIEKQDAYVLMPGAAGPLKLLAPIDITGAPVTGDANAPITVVEFADFSCPYCAAASGDNAGLIATMKQRDQTWEPIVTNLLKDYVATGKVKFVSMYSMGHSGGHPAQLVAWCLNEQGLFWKFYAQAYANQADVEDLTKMKALAATLGADTMALNTCLDSKKYDGRFDIEQARAAQYGASGTPAFFINGTLISPGAIPYSQVKSAIDAMLS